MSTTAQPLTRVRSHENRDLTDLYTLVTRSPEVCGTCHARIRDRETHEGGSLSRLGTGNRPTETLTRAGDGVVGHDIEVPGWDPYGTHAKHVARTYCDRCGTPGGRAPDRTPSKRAMLDRVDALVTRLAEAGIPVNPAVLQQVVGDLKTDPDHEAKTTEIWRAATAVAHERARPRDCVRVTFGPEVPP